MKTFIYLVLTCLCAVGLSTACEDVTTDVKQSDQQEQILAEGNAQTGMPAIKNFRERKLLKAILELRDQSDLSTYTYTYSEMTGKLTFFCDSIGYPIPYATQYTNPYKIAHDSVTVVIPQADPNALYSPASAEGTWIMCKDPNGPDTRPVYVEPRVITSQFKLALQ